MVLTYRRPGVYLEESLLVNPVDVAGTITVAAFVGVASKGPINEPQLCTSWSDYVTVFGDFANIVAPIPDPNVSYRIVPQPPPQTLALLQNSPIYGNGLYVGDAFSAGQYVLLGDASKAYYLTPALSTNRAAAAPNQMFASDPNITAADPDNASELIGEGFVATPNTAWTAGQNIWVGPYAFYWAGAAANEVHTITPTTVTAGTFKLTVLGVQTGDIAWNATSTIVKAAIDAVIPGNRIAVAGGPVNTTPITLTYTGYGNIPLTQQVSVQSSLTGSLAVATTTQGGGWSAGTAGATAAVDGTAKFNNGAWVGTAAPGTQSVKDPSVLSYLPFAVYSFFQNGGRFAWIIRSVDSAHPGTAAAIDVNSTLGSGSALQSFKLTARSVGTWGNTIKYLLVTQDTIGPANDLQDIFTLQILVTNADGKDEVVETWRSLSVRGNNPEARRVNAVLNDAASGSRYVYVSNVNDNRPQPTQTTVATALVGGINPGFPREDGLRASADYTSKIEGPVALNIVGYLDDASVADDVNVASHFVGNTVSPSSFQERQDLVVVNDSAPPRTPGDSSSAYQSIMVSALNADSGDSYAMSYGPWIIIPHPGRIGTTIAIPPGGAVMGMMARIDATVGVFRAPAGVIAGLSNAIGVQTKFTDAELGDLNAQNINVIRSVVGAGICVMGARTRKSYGTDRYVSARRTLIYLKEALRRSTQFAVFENNDQRLWEALRMSAERILRPMWEAGGLRGSSANDAYYATCDETLNTPAVIQSGEVRMEVGVALEYPAEFVVIRVTQFERGTFTAEVSPNA